MARRPRMDLPGVPQHVVQRGNNRSVCFFDDTNYFAFLRFLDLARQKAVCRVHAYVLMTNHVHLVVTGDQPGSVSIMMQSLGRRYVRYVNEQCGRTGSLWEGRYRSTLIDTERYLLACYRYVELNPVRAGIVKVPEEYPWYSFRHHVNERRDFLIEDHDVFLSMGRTADQRAVRYRALCNEAIEQSSLDEIRSMTNRGYVLGSEQFAARVGSALGRRVAPGQAGRPKKKSGSENHFQLDKYPN
jgi:putative transposase